MVGAFHVGRRELHVRRVGTGFPLLLINGLGLPLGMWSHLEPELAGSELIEVDLPGAGHSAATRPPLTMRSYARLARRLLDTLDIEAADVLGLSFGGMVAQQLAIDWPDRVRKLVLVSTNCGWGSAPVNPVSWTLGFLSRQARSPRSAYELLCEEFGENAAPFPHVLGFARQVLAASTWSSLPWLPAVQHETLVIAGTADTLVPSVNASVLATWMPHARLHLVRSGGHLCVLNRAHEVGPVIRSFLTTDEAAAPGPDGGRTVALRGRPPIAVGAPTSGRASGDIQSGFVGVLPTVPADTEHQDHRADGGTSSTSPCDCSPLVNAAVRPSHQSRPG